MTSAIYFRTLAARCRTSARDCRDHFAKEEFNRLAREFQTRANQLETSQSSINTLPGQSNQYRRADLKGIAENARFHRIPPMAPRPKWGKIT
jgi:uncharacterized protein HemX